MSAMGGNRNSGDLIGSLLETTGPIDMDSGTRLPLLDLLRIVASLFVVHLHMTRQQLFDVGMGLPVFLVLFFALFSTSLPQESLWQTLSRRGPNLLVPWLRWSLIYLVMTVTADWVRGLDPFGRLTIDMALIGGNAVLWFLPFAAFALLPARFFNGVAGLLKEHQGIVFLLLVGIALTALSVVLAQSGVQDPFLSWVRCLPALGWGLAIGNCSRLGVSGGRRFMFALVALTAIVVSLFVPHVVVLNEIVLRLAIAVPLVCLGFAWNPGPLPGVRELASATFGIYLIHPFVGKVLAEFPFSFYSYPRSHALLVWCLAVVLVLALRRSGLGWRELAGTSRSREDLGKVLASQPAATFLDVHQDDQETIF